MRKTTALMTVLLFIFSYLPAEACTLWAANGNEVQGGGSLIVKNRDWEPDHRQGLRIVTPARGYKYYGLFAVDGEHQGLKAGINEKGLVIVSATAGSIPTSIRKQMPYTKSLMAKLLQECSNVDEVLTKTDSFLGPQILMIADRQKIATIEIGPEGAFSSAVKQNGITYHTNHYLLENMLTHNRTLGESSQKRIDRIAELLNDAPRPYNLDSFIAFANDQRDGPDNGIFRKGSTPRKTRTLATWAVWIPPSGSPKLHIRILNPGEEERTIIINADDAFKGK